MNAGPYWLQMWLRQWLADNLLTALVVLYQEKHFVPVGISPVIRQGEGLEFEGSGCLIHFERPLASVPDYWRGRAVGRVQHYFAVSLLVWAGARRAHLQLCAGLLPEPVCL